MIRLVRSESSDVPTSSHVYASCHFEQYALFEKKTTQAKTVQKATVRLNIEIVPFSHSRIGNLDILSTTKEALNSDQTAHHRSRERIEARLDFKLGLKQ
jgi:hypothetical protein